MAEGLERAEDEEGRSWRLLAVERAKEIETRMAERREELGRKLARLERSMLDGRIEEANAMRREVVESYGGYSELGDLLAPLRAELEEEGAGKGEPTPSKPSGEGESKGSRPMKESKSTNP